MIDYKSLYYSLFNGITNVTEKLETKALSADNEQLRAELEKCIVELRQLQAEAERRYISE